ncbi:inositol-3-phosphate synthase [Geodermatophilus sp. TF02-6]|uniref:inositol-3-phosphate synthase n=1 Tax=Geodermatophilus sp. TF02-6 TaxID=2250575 RepID=UPI0018F69E5D|nr:inositol-3-phosphate synthase [Geodermatophilus sp. TF02-6]
MAVVGLGGAVATTAVAGLELLRSGSSDTSGLPLAGVEVDGVPVEEATGLVPYTDLVVGGWDLDGSDLRKAAEQHGVLDSAQLERAAAHLSSVTPWAAAGDADFCRNVTGGNVVLAETRRAQVDAVRADLARFREEQRLDGLVLVNLASTERWPDPSAPALQSAEAFEAGLDADDRSITPAMVYAYAAIAEGVGYVNFTPSLAADVPALVELAEQRGVPVTGKDGKTGQTMIKTVLAPAFRSRALTVEGWYSTNILGNRDGLALEDPDSLSSKLQTKGNVLDSILGYPVEDHLVRIDYYRPRGDAKEAWDAIDLVGFLGRRMQVKIDFQCRDSILAAPLAIELARLTDLAQQRGERGVQTQFGWFFKAPMTPDGNTPEHALHRQERVLLDWLAAGPADR